MAGGFSRGRAAPAVESKIFFKVGSTRDFYQTKIEYEQMDTGRPCRKESSPRYMMNVIRKAKDGDDHYTL